MSEMIRVGQCCNQALPTEDCDGDGVRNSADLRPYEADNADSDGDTVINAQDKHPGSDDTTFDLDGDGIADHLDTFLGDNNLDADGDGLLNGVDMQPYSAPPAGNATPQPPSTCNNEQLIQELLREQMRRKFYREPIFELDADLDGIPDDKDRAPDLYTNDRDGDHEPDFYDPEPGDPYTDSRNDPFDSRNDEYWED
ncbi:hypothetical protein [Georgenia sp. AZ-5]|uniref:hypothetical protein n=1 Tax=Georgenia sp. AZ-5 TaxID=3367526 RepID=UPI003754D669